MLKKMTSLNFLNGKFHCHRESGGNEGKSPNIACNARKGDIGERTVAAMRGSQGSKREILD